MSGIVQLPVNRLFRFVTGKEMPMSTPLSWLCLVVFVVLIIAVVAFLMRWGRWQKRRDAEFDRSWLANLPDDEPQYPLTLLNRRPDDEA